MYCFLQFSKARYTLENNYTLESFLLNGTGSRWKKLDSFCKKLSVNQLNFQFKYGKVKYQFVFLWLLTTLTDNFRSVETFLFPVPYFTTDLGNNNKSVEA